MKFKFQLDFRINITFCLIQTHCEVYPAEAYFLRENSGIVRGSGDFESHTERDREPTV